MRHPAPGRVLAGLYALGVAFPACLAALLVGTAETLEGRVFGVAALLLLSLPVAAWRAWINRRSRRPVLGIGVVTAALVVALAAMAPPGIAAPGCPVQSRFPGRMQYARWSLANLLPEIDQIKLGTWIIPAFDPILDLRGAARLRAVSMQVYRAMDRDPDYRALGSVMNYAYADADSGQFYAYTPAHHPGERLPVVIFLHGSAGNFKPYFHLMRRVADARHALLVCPSFGLGNWYQPGGVEAVERVRRYAVERLEGDPGRVFLVGLSNGGTGVTRVAAANPGRYAGLALISAVIETEVVASEGFRTGWAGRPVLIVHGARDDRIPVAYVEAAIEELHALGADVETVLEPTEDHFLMFSRPLWVLDHVADWMARHGG